MALQIEVPAFEDQQTIARYLDNAELRIARAIQAKQRTLSLVLERERALLADLLTPYIPQRLGGAADADLAVAPLRAVYQESNERSVTGGEELLSVSHITGVTPRSHKNVTMFMAASHIGYKLVQPDDLAVNTMWAWMGAMGVSEYPGIVSPSYSVYRPRPNSPLLPAYLHHLLRSAAYVDEYNRASTGVTASRARLYPWQLLRLPVCLPDEGAQRRVLADANSVAASTAAAADALRTEIALLREYRTRLISDVVSGKKDVRAEAAGMKDVGPAELATVLGGATDSGNDDVEGDEDVE
jgi:type I restriction enzyme S subunit